MPKIEVRDLYKIFGRKPESVLKSVKTGVDKDEVLRETGHTVGLGGVSLSVEEGETFVVMGLSGSGKSTLVRCLNRLVEPTSGQIVIDGQDVTLLERRDMERLRREKMGMVFQHFALLPHRNVIDNVAYGLKIQGEEREQRYRRAQQWIDAVGLSGYERSRPTALSGGMQQRVGLARALATDPEILLMDEAFSALDPLIRKEMQDLLVELQRKLSKTIVFITHDLDEALRLGDRVAILKDGHVVQIDTPEEILLAPADEYVRSFVQNVDRGRVLTAGTVVGRARQRDGRNRADVVPEGAPTVSAGTPLNSLMSLSAGSSLPIAVITEDGRLLGTLSHRTILGALAGDAAGAPLETATASVPA